MARAPGRKLKVYQARLGFFDTVVAAPSQKAALAAWGTHQDLFANGDAKVTGDEAAARAAVDHPGTPLQRPAGSHDPFELQPAGLPDPPSRRPRSKAAKARPAPPKPPADRSGLEAAEKALKELDRRRASEEADMRREQDALDARQAAAREAYVAARRKATAAVAAARAADRKAGGVQR